MQNFINYQYQTSLKADADVHAGGHLFWKLYRDILTLDNESNAILKRVYSKNNGTEIHEEKTIFEGKFMNPSKGYYLFDLELKNRYSERKWCCDLVEDNKLICHGTLKVIGENQLNYESEIFEIIK